VPAGARLEFDVLRGDLFPLTFDQGLAFESASENGVIEFGIGFAGILFCVRIGVGWGRCFFLIVDER
jgi:hypothetical protein